MSLLGWVVGAALLDEWGRREEEEREKEELRQPPNPASSFDVQARKTGVFSPL